MGAYNRGVGRQDLGWSRQYLFVAAVFALLFVVAFGLFAQLTISQLSRSYLEDVLLTGRAQAEELAKQFRGEGPLYQVVEKKKEALQRLSLSLARKEVIESVEVYDERGRLVWRTTTRSEGVPGGFPEPGSEFVPLPQGEHVMESQTSYQIRVPVEELATVVVSIPKSALEQRIALLRRQLVVRTALAGGATLTMMVLAFVFIGHLIKRNAELEARRLRDRELAALGVLAANLAHEIRNPLNALSIHLDLVAEETSADPSAAEAVALAKKEVSRLRKLVTDFLQYARPSPPQKEPVEVEAFLRDVAALLGPECERAGASLTVGASAGTLLVDRGQMTQVLLNLGLNALQALHEAAVKQITLRAFRDGSHWVLAVEDSGKGIPPEELPRVKEAFYSNRKGGTGLGLAIADRIVVAHGGQLILQNRPQGGLSAQVRLPAAAEGVYTLPGGKA
ncbi:MAG: sensor histidine kinase [Thermoanaerobaculum sp.]|nr:MAG: sensor histidine kinase [Thermoanaerobaculum sp.]